jgi:aryl carrier-like protein
VRHTANDTPLLVGYVASTDPRFDLAKARTLLAERLPSAMVPRLVRIDELPTRVSGKVDRDALPWPPPDGYGHADVRHDIVVPRDEIEATLATIWCETLGVEAVSVTDDVFDLGADSLLTARISILAREAGYALTPRDLVENPTLEALALRAREARPTAINLRVPQGDTPLSPMQRYYFTWATPNPNKFNVGFIARLATPLDPELLQQAFRIVIEHHPALRLRFRRDADGGFVQRHESVDVASEVPIQRIQLPEGSEDVRAAFIEGEMTHLNDSLDICDGPTITVGLFEQGSGTESQDNQFFFAMHQLISDAVSLDITLEDLRAAYTSLAAGRDPVLPGQTMLFHQWVDHLIDYARGPAAAQWDYWLDQMRDAHGFPEDDASAGALQRDIEILEFEVLSASEVDEVRARCGGSFHATLIHATVAALALAAHRISGQRNLVLHKTAHGRETCIPGADVSRTVGWFVTHTPITVRLPDGPLDDVRVLPRVLEHVAELYRAIPDNGLAHSALRYFSDDPRAVELARFDQVKTLLNYVGDVWESGYDGRMFVPPTSTALMDIPDAAAAENLADYHKHVYAYLRDGAFRIDLFYTRPNHLPDTMSRIARLLSEQIRGMLLRH